MPLYLPLEIRPGLPNVLVPRGQGGGKPPMMARKNQSVIEGPKLELLNTCQSTMSRTGDSLPPFRPSVTSLPAGQSLYLMQQDNNYNAQQQPSRYLYALANLLNFCWTRDLLRQFFQAKLYQRSK